MNPGSPPRSGRRARYLNAAWLALLAGHLLVNAAAAMDLRGHVKGQATSVDIPSDSLLQEYGDDPANDSSLELRVNIGERTGGWHWQADYQLLASQGDRLEIRRQQPAFDFGAAAFPDDDRRLFDLTHVISEDEDRIVAHRLDRLAIGYSSDKTVLSLGRQAISWGNGLIYNPVDFFNPFDPAAIDTEYKTGDDMLYSQYLFDSGADLQALWVARRDSEGDVDSDVASLATKFHGFAAAAEYDLLLAEHYDASVVAIGGVFDAGGAILRGDAMLTDTGDDRFGSAVVNWSYSWVAWERNLSASLEYFHNGFGIDDGDYGPASLAANPELVERVRRGELFTLAQNYLGVTATLFNNLDDDSRLWQLFARHDWQQDLQLLLAVNLPQGDEGSEFGGIDSAIPGRPLSTGESLFAQLAWYF